MLESQSIQNIVPALIKFQKDVEDPKKDAANAHFRMKYVTIDNLIKTIKPTLAKHDLAFTQDVTSEGGLVVVTSTLYHKSGEWLRAVTRLPVDKQTPQGTGSAFTYAKRYSLSALLGISADEDDDGNRAEDEAKKKAVKVEEAKKELPDHLKRLYALSESKKWSVQEITSFLKEAFGVDSSQKLSKEQCEILIKTIESMNYNDAMEDLPR